MPYWNLKGDASNPFCHNELEITTSSWTSVLLEDSVLQSGHRPLQAGSKSRRKEETERGLGVLNLAAFNH